jgi:hypothetical protein
MKGRATMNLQQEEEPTDEPDMHLFELDRIKIRLEDLSAENWRIRRREEEASQELFRTKHALSMCREKLAGLKLQTDADGEDIVHLHSHLEKARMMSCILHAIIMSDREDSLQKAAHDFAEMMGWPDMVSVFSADNSLSQFIDDNFSMHKERMGRWR